MMLYICGKEKQPESQVVSAEGPSRGNLNNFQPRNGIAKSQNEKLKVCLAVLGRHENARTDLKDF